MARFPEQYTREFSFHNRGRFNGSTPNKNRPSSYRKSAHPAAVQKRYRSPSTGTEDRSGPTKGDEQSWETIIPILRTYEDRLAALEDNLQGRHRTFEQNSRDVYKELDDRISAQEKSIRDMVSVQNQRTQEALESDKERNDKLNHLSNLLQSMFVWL